jgi:thioredoxin 1
MSDGVIYINGDNWDSEVLKSDVPVLVDFWAEWCGPCKAIAPILDELAKDHAGKLKIAKVNVDENQELAGEHGIRSIPTLLVYQGGDIKEQMIGALNKSALEAKLAPYV